jgi:hypothetical protein
VTVIETPGSFNARYGWLAIPLVIDGTFRFTVLVSGFPRSVMRSDVIADLPAFFQQSGPDRYVMRRATIGSEAVTGLEVVASGQIGRLRVDGALGQDFLGRFTDINLNIPTMMLTFTTP